MASSKDIPSRPMTQHRSSLSNAPSSSLPMRQSHNRQHSNSLTVGSLNSAHRVTRRKSMSSTVAANVAAMAATAHGAEDSYANMSRRSFTSKGLLSSKGLGSALSSSVPGMSQASDVGSVPKTEAGAGDDIGPLESIQRPQGAHNPSRGRRSSEGAYLSKTEAKKLQGGELRCETCGKGYKHGSCLSKHLWEHTPEWSYTSKLLISKHQQVQLLEAASVLVAMNQDTLATPDASKHGDSDNSSASPGASGSSDSHDGVSSVETTPPPQSDDMGIEELPNQAAATWGRHRMGSISSAYSQSYQSVRSNSIVGSSIPTAISEYSNVRRQSGDQRSVTPGTAFPWKAGDEEEASLAAAVELLSCSFGTPRSGAFQNPEDVPPVPPLPARYMDTASKQTGAASGTTQPNSDVNMSGSGYVYDDDEYDGCSQSRGRDDEDDDGVFGQMEE